MVTILSPKTTAAEARPLPPGSQVNRPKPHSLTAMSEVGDSKLARRLAGASFLMIGTAAWWWLATHHFGTLDHADLIPAVPIPSAASEAALTSGTRDVVALLATSQAAAEIRLTTVEMRPLRDHITVPGRLDYDARCRLDYASPVDGIVSKVFVDVRQKVAKGDSLAEVSSPEVGSARDDVRKREDTREIEKKAAAWTLTIAENVNELLAMLSSHPPLEKVEQQFESRILGAYREKILSGYSRLLYVEKVNASTQQLSEGGVLSGRIVEERISNLEVAKANFIAACEEAKFLTQQERDRAQAALEQADRLVRIAQENLRMLVGSRLGDEAEVIAVGAELPPDSPSDVYAISSLILRTPFEGLVEDVFVVRGERVQAGDKLFVVADTATLWVRAQIHERQWTDVEVSEGQSVRVTVPGAGVHQSMARINHVGAVVEADSRSVSLVAELDNDDAHYKPGMFVWVDLPQGEIREALSVPTSAVMRHESKAFVFVAEGEDRFRRHNIRAGISSGDYVEVQSGLKEGQKVVSEGAFILKSELLLEGNQDESGSPRSAPVQADSKVQSIDQLQSLPPHPLPPNG